jgi:hypothetical protein
MGRPCPALLFIQQRRAETLLTEMSDEALIDLVSLDIRLATAS